MKTKFIIKAGPSKKAYWALKALVSGKSAKLEYPQCARLTDV